MRNDRDRRRDALRRVRDRIVTVVVSVAGLLSIAILIGIFGLLLVRSVAAFRGGVETEPLTEAEREALGPETVAALEEGRHGPPSLWRDVLTEPTWRPEARRDPSYGIGAMVMSTLLTTFGALAWSVPVGIATAAWLAFGAAARLRSLVKFAVEMLAAVPSVVVGFIGLELLGPLIGRWFDAPGGLTALNGALLLGVMALPTIVSLAEDALTAVPRPLVEGALALGADRFQTLTQVVAPAARSGLFAAIMLGMGRAIGETMTVLMATGNATAMPSGFLDPVRTLTATIAIELGEVARGTTHYRMLFAVGLLLFLITLGVNLAADYVQRRGEARLRG